MRATVERKAFLDCLAFVSRYAERGDAIPILSHLLINAGDGRLTVTGTNLDQIARESVGAEIGTPGAVCLPAGRLAGFVKSTTGSEIVLSVEDKQASLSCGRSRVIFPVLPPEDFPHMPMIEAAGTAAISMSGALLADIWRIEYAVSTEQTRYYLAGIHWAIEDGAIEFCATDGHKLATLRRDFPGVTPRDGIIVPRFDLPAWTGDVSVAISEQFIRVSDGRRAVASKLIDGTFPDYRRAIPDNQTRLLFDREGLIAALGRSALVKDGKSAASSSILFVGRDGVATLSATSALGELTEEVAYDGDDFEITIAAENILPCLSSFDCEMIELRWADHQTAVTIHNRGDTSRLAVVMPYRDARINEFIRKAAA